MDYIGLSKFLNLSACETRRCVTVTIVNDLVCEPEEVFDLTLERTVGLNPRIRLQPTDGRVFISDNEGMSISNVLRMTLRAVLNMGHTVDYLFPSTCCCWP